MIGRARWVAVTVALLALAVVAVVARSHPSHPIASLSAGPAPSVVHEVTPTAQTSTVAVPTLEASARHSSSPSTDLRWLGSLLLALVAAGAVLALGRFTRGRWGFSLGDRGRRRPGQVSDVPAAAPFAPSELTDAVQQGVDDLDHGPVSDAIVECWVRVEAAAQQAGFGVRRSETSTEFVDRVLGTFGAREQSLRRMSQLYREARFSEHEMGEPSRADARRCLAEIRDDLGRAREQA